MDAETLRRKGQEMLFREDLRAYEYAVAKISGETREYGDLGDPQVVLDCLTTLTDRADELTDTWWTTMRQARSDDDDQDDGVYEEWERIRGADASHDDDPDPEPSKDSGNVGLDTLTKRELHDILDRSELSKIELLVRKKLP